MISLGKTVGCLLVFLCSVPVQVVAWHQDNVVYENIPSDQRAKLAQWIGEYQRALESLFGPLPMAYRITVLPSNKANEPVPWAETNKRSMRRIRFFVAHKYSLNAFMSDWTAPHEMVHMMHHYLGTEGAWIAEGLASYYQFILMHQANQLTWPQVVTRFQQRTHVAKSSPDFDMTLQQLTKRFREKRAFVRMYWWGASYFLKVDYLLAQQGTRLHLVLRQYLACCSKDRSDVLGFLKQLDRLAGSDLFVSHYHAFLNMQQLPELKNEWYWFANQGKPTNKE